MSNYTSSFVIQKLLKCVNMLKWYVICCCGVCYFFHCFVALILLVFFGFFIYWDSPFTKQNSLDVNSLHWC